jgi:hypothetical protein
MEHLVEFKQGSNHDITADPCDMYRDKKDTIKWKNDTDTNYTIHFDNCPLRDNDVPVPAKGKSKAIPLRDNVSANIYTYRINAMPGSVMAADPNVIVH